MPRFRMTTIFVVGLCAAIGLTALFNQTNEPAQAQQAKGAEPAAKDDRAADQLAVRALILEFAAAFQKGDAVAATAFMTSGAELIPSEGARVRGREAIQKAFTEHFAKTARARIKLESESLHFPARDMAVEEGTMKVSPVKGSASTNNYGITYVREDGKWLIAVIREWASEQESLHDLDWLIGTWSAKRGEAEVQTTYDWFGNKSFIRGTISIKGKDKSFTGMQMIGIDPNTGDLRTWTFEVDGGFGEGTCNREGNKWIFEGATALSDGRVMTAKNIMVQVNADTFTWQPVSIAIDGAPLADIPPVKVTRVKSKQ